MTKLYCPNCPGDGKFWYEVVDKVVVDAGEEHIETYSGLPGSYHCNACDELADEREDDE